MVSRSILKRVAGFDGVIPEHLDGIKRDGLQRTAPLLGSLGQDVVRHGHDMRAASFGLIDIEDFADAGPQQLAPGKMGDLLLSGDHQRLRVDPGVGGDGDAFSIGGNHFTHTARKNVRLTYVVMDNSVYGLTKNQTSPTSPIGFKSKTDIWGSKDRPINPIKQAISAGATFVARTTATSPNHVLAMMEAAMDHDGFSFIQCLSECVEFYPGAFDAATPRKGGVFNEISKEHDVTDEYAAYKLADTAWPGLFGVYYKTERPTKNANEQSIIDDLQGKSAGLEPWQILKKNFDRMK